jgi:SAM-dependent methyltransferase
VRSGIPLMYPATMDMEHLREEEDLARMMKLPVVSESEKFNREQWALSKKEFWGVVEREVKRSGQSFVNIGCGFDKSFKTIEDRGNLFVNFDMVSSMLEALCNESGAQSCVAGDINRLPFRKGHFDHVVSIDVIHHECDNLRPLLQSFRDLLKPGGTLFLEDPNAWGMFQAAKSVLLPRSLYRFLRSTYHRLKRSTHRPADYEFPTSVWQVMDLLKQLGFKDIKIYPHTAYPTIIPAAYRIYKLLSGTEYVRKYHNYHYMLSAVKA